MFRFSTFSAAPALVLLLSGTAHAALTADQVWQSWKDGAAQAGLTITAATEANSGGVLTLNGITIMPAGAPSGLTISDMTLTEESDGSVTIRPGASMGVDVAEGNNKMALSVVHDGLTMVAKEADGGLVYDFSAAKLDVDFSTAMEGFSADASQPAPVSTAAGKIGLSELAGSYSDTPGANRAFGLDIAAKSLAYDVSSEDPGMSMKSASKTETADVALNLDLTLPSTTPLASIQGPADFRKVLEEGFAVALAFSQGAGSGTASQENMMFPYQMTVSSQPGKGNVQFNKDAFTMQTEGAGMQLNVTSPAAPAPIDVTTGTVAMNLVVPVMAAAPADVVMKMTMNQVTLGDAVWGMFDPNAALKREPLDLNIDVTGKTTLDLIAMAEAEETGAQPPIPAPENIDITDITLKVAGAALMAKGAFTFDNSMGMPMPLGSADVNVTGANQLIDGLIATGLLKEEDAMGARMMMGMFMTPSGDDSLTSKIEMKEGFAIFVNGQQIQ